MALTPLRVLPLLRLQYYSLRTSLSSLSPENAELQIDIDRSTVYRGFKCRHCPTNSEVCDSSHHRASYMPSQCRHCPTNSEEPPKQTLPQGQILLGMPGHQPLVG